jgi:hypothetical protein
MKRHAAFLAAVAALTVGAWSSSPPPAYSAPASVTLESQGWWRKAGIVVPSQVGEHVHVQATVPVDGVPINGRISVPVKVTLHNHTGKTNWLRVADGSTPKQSWPIAIGPCGDCTWTSTVVVDFSSWGTGRREMRWSANVPDNSEGKRHYQSTGWQVCVRSCSPSYRSGPFTEARGWYEGRGYANARLTSTLSTVRSGGTIKVALKPGSGGFPTRFSGIYIDPDFHAGSSGRVVRESTSAFTGSVALPSMTSGSHRLVLLSSDGLNAGVQVVPFEVP